MAVYILIVFHIGSVPRLSQPYFFYVKNCKCNNKLSLYIGFESGVVLIEIHFGLVP